MHKDKEGQLLVKGFYMKEGLAGLAVYFTGEYDAGGNAITEGHERVCSYPPTTTSEWVPIEKAEDYMFFSQDRLEKFKQAVDSNTKWLQRKISQLEQIANKANLSTQKPQTEEPINQRGQMPITYLEDDIPF